MCRIDLKQMSATVSSLGRDEEEKFVPRSFRYEIEGNYPTNFSLVRKPEAQIIPLLGKQNIHELASLPEYKDSLFVIPVIVRGTYPKMKYQVLLNLS